MSQAAAAARAVAVNSPVLMVVGSEIQKLVLSGRMGEAIDTTQQLYPSLLERNPDLLFMLK